MGRGHGGYASKEFATCNGSGHAEVLKSSLTKDASKSITYEGIEGNPREWSKVVL